MENKIVVPLQKYCPGCESIQDTVFFGVDKARKDGLNPYCKECKKKRYQEYIANEENKAKKKESNKLYLADPVNRERANTLRRDRITDPTVEKDKRLRANYNITLNEYLLILSNQGFHCALCPRNTGDSGQWLAVDHDHNCCPGKKSCGKCVRGLLCPDCNRKLGHIENTVWLEVALSYLQNPTHEELQT